MVEGAGVEDEVCCQAGGLVMGRQRDRKTARRLWWAGMALALVSALGLWVRSRGLSLYHQERGVHLLAQALMTEGREVGGNAWLLLPEPLTDAEARALAEQAAARFRAAFADDPASAQAHHWLGWTLLLLDKPGEAAEVFSVYVRLRPDNPMGWWELGVAYEWMAQRLKEAVYWVLFAEDDHSTAVATIEARRVATASLLQAEVETPGVPIDTPYCEQGEMPRSCFVAPMKWEMPDAPFDTTHGKPDGQPQEWWQPEEPVCRAVLFMHPPSRATFQVTLPVTPTALAFWIGIDPAAWSWMRDGVVYKAWVDGEQIFGHYLTAEEARQGWWPGQVNLMAWAGREVSLTLETDPGPDYCGQGDWAGWGEVRLVEAAEAAYALADPARRMAAAWEAGDFTAQDFINIGEETRKAKRYEEALGWYERALVLAPDMQSTYFCLHSLVLEALKDQEGAAADLEQAVSLDTGWLDQKMRFEAWFRWGRWLYSQQKLAEAEIALQKAIEIYPEDSQGLQPLLSEAYRFLGLAQWAQQKMDLAVHNMRLAVQWNDQNAWAHIHFGKALYLQDQEQAEETEREFAYALTLRPEDVSLWVNLVQFWRWVDEDSRADDLCSQAKDRIDPDAQLEGACSPP